MDTMSKRMFPGGPVDLWEIKFRDKVNIEVKKEMGCKFSSVQVELII